MDKTKTKFNTYSESFPWLSAYYVEDEQTRKDMLKKYGSLTVPHAILIDMSTNNIIDSNFRHTLQNTKI